MYVSIAEWRTYVRLRKRLWEYVGETESYVRSTPIIFLFRLEWTALYYWYSERSRMRRPHGDTYEASQATLHMYEACM